MRRAKVKSAMENDEPGEAGRGLAASQAGQVTILVMLALVFFFLGFLGFTTDLSNLWFRRQAAQNTADAACTAAVMDLLLDAQGSPTSTQGFTAGTPFDCKTTPGAAPCRYASLNGYSGAGLLVGTDSNDVSVSFPGSVPGVGAPSASLAAFPYVRVDIIDRVRVFLSGLITGSKTWDVRAFAVCGLVQAKAPVPIVVLNPTCQDAFQVSGSSTIKVIGGPFKSIQVNSGNQTCAAATGANSCVGNGVIDLSQAGPNFTGSLFGVFGAPAVAPPNFLPGSTGGWQSPGTPIADPFALTPAPAVPITALASTSVPYGTNGCPDRSKNCVNYHSGLYNSRIIVKNETAIFDPGIYYIQPATFDSEGGGVPGCTTEPKPKGLSNYDFAVDSNGVVRPSTAVGDGSGGVMFYLSGPGGASGYGSVFFGANAGKSGGRTVDPFDTSGVTCPGGPVPNPPLPPSLSGNVLLGPCTAGGTYIPFDKPGPIRGLVFFQDRNNGTNGYVQGQPSMQGGGGLLLSGNLYFHNCPNSVSGPCAPYPTNYNAFFQLQGTPGPGTYLLGNITADQLVSAGNGQIFMQLDPNAVFNIVKASLLR